MVTYLPGSGDVVADAVKQVGDAIRNRINPNYAFQKAMQQRIAEDPAYLKSLSDLAKNAGPGFLTSLGFAPSQEQAIGKVPESIGSQVERETRGTQVSTAKKQIETQGNLAGQQLEISKLPLDPYDQMDALRQQFGLGTQAQSTIDKAKASVAGDVAAAEGAKAKVERKIADYTFNLGILGPVNFRELVDNISKGKSISPEILAQIAAYPGAPEAFAAAQRAYQLDRNLDEARIRAREGQAGVDKVLYRQAVDDARGQANKSGAGSPAAWLFFDPVFGDPNILQRIEQLKQKRLEDPNSLSPQEADLLAVADYKIENQQIARSKNIADLTSKISTQLTQISNIEKNLKGKDLENNLKSRAQELNVLLDERSKIPGAEVLKAEPYYDKKFIGGKWRLRLTKPTGEEVPLSTALVPPIPTSTTKDTTANNVPATANEIISSLRNKEFSYNEYVASEDNPQRLQEVRDSLGLDASYRGVPNLFESKPLTFSRNGKPSTISSLPDTIPTDIRQRLGIEKTTSLPKTRENIGVIRADAKRTEADILSLQNEIVILKSAVKNRSKYISNEQAAQNESRLSEALTKLDELKAEYFDLIDKYDLPRNKKIERE